MKSKVDLICVCYDKKLHQFKEIEATDVVVGIIDLEDASKHAISLGELVARNLAQENKLLQLEENQKNFVKIVESQQTVLNIFMQKYPELAIDLQNLKLEKENEK